MKALVALVVVTTSAAAWGLEIGESVTLTAEIEGSRPITVTWLLDGVVLGTGNPFVWETSGELPGIYRLEALATNPYGNGRASELVELVGRIETGWIAEPCRVRPCVFGRSEVVRFSGELPTAIFYAYDWEGDGVADAWLLEPAVQHTFSDLGEHRPDVTLYFATGGSSRVTHPVPIQITREPPVFLDGFEENLNGW